MLSFGFPPVAAPGARVLILGTLPSRISLDRGQYYANPQNAFWKIMATGIADLPSDYAARVAALTRRGIALWDVLAAATRSGSLDAAIANDAIANNFGAFFNAHPDIQLICFNGQTAATLFQKYVVPSLTPRQRAIGTQTLPSTSPAHASLPLAQKSQRWAIAMTPATPHPHSDAALQSR